MSPVLFSVDGGEFQRHLDDGVVVLGDRRVINEQLSHTDRQADEQMSRQAGEQTDR